MAKINLLPWREERREELKKEFLVVLVGVIVIAGGLVLLADRVVSAAITYQQARNQYLQKHIAELEEQVQEIAALEEEKRKLLERMKVIQELQGTRPVIVRVFDDVVRTLPDGVFYQKMAKTDKKIVINGVAESNNRVSSLMRKLDASNWFVSPNLTGVSAVPQYGEQASAFDMSVVIDTPDIEAVEDK